MAFISLYGFELVDLNICSLPTVSFRKLQNICAQAESLKLRSQLPRNSSEEAMKLHIVENTSTIWGIFIDANGPNTQSMYALERGLIRKQHRDLSIIQKWRETETFY